MNKIYLIAGGASVVSLAAGGAAGYFYAKKQFDETVEARIDVAVLATKKYYSVQLMEAKTKPDSPADIPKAKVAEPVPAEAEPDEITEKDRESLRRKGEAARTNYAGYSDKPALSTVVQNNIFSNPPEAADPKKSLPPKDPATGRFVPKKQRTAEDPEQEPYRIEPDVFLENEPEFDQESLWWFAKDETAIMVADNEEVEIGKIGAVNLTLFDPEIENDVIFVRNPGLGIDYQITRTFNSLTAHMGLGEEEHEYDDLEAGDLRVDSI